MDEMKKLELAIELAKIEALERLRAAVEGQLSKGEKPSMLMAALRDSARPGVEKLVQDALVTLEALMAQTEQEQL